MKEKQKLNSVQKTVKVIETGVAINKPVFVWGPPGVGKSSVVQQIAEKENRKLYDVRALLLESIDLRGLPTIKGNETVWTKPAFLPATEETEPTLLFLDELNAADPSVQAACYQLILDRRIGEYKLPDNCRIVAAGNRSKDKAYVHKMPSALVNRMIHVTMESDVRAWLEWAAGNGIEPEVIFYISFSPESLISNTFDVAEGEAFPTPRAWETLSRELTHIKSENNGELDPEDEVLIEIANGTVGSMTAAGFLGFLRTYKDLPRWDDIIKDPDNAKIPKDAQGKSAVGDMIARKVRPDLINPVAKYISRLSPEFGEAIWAAIAKNGSWVYETMEYQAHEGKRIAEKMKRQHGA